MERYLHNFTTQMYITDKRVPIVPHEKLSHVAFACFIYADWN